MANPSLRSRGRQESMATEEVHTWDVGIPYWSYDLEDGSCDWGQHFPEANGQNQSPININSRDAVYDPKLNDIPLQFNYGTCRETDVCNNGYAIVCSLRYKPGEATFRTEAVPKSYVGGGPLTPRHEYELMELRFHWGREDSRGSEHTVNCKAFPMELHMIHFNSTLYPCLEDALGKPDGIVIIALIVQVGRDHPGLKLITEQLEDVQYKGRQKTITTAINATCFLPDPMLRDFWSYEGSLTSPPCSENVHWLIFRYPLTISATQIEEFRRLRTYHKGDAPGAGEDGILVDNFRPTQQLNDRQIRASFQT